MSCRRIGIRKGVRLAYRAGLGKAFAREARLQAFAREARLQAFAREARLQAFAREARLQAFAREAGTMEQGINSVDVTSLGAE
ncbi:unnamed protein product [Lota lota]